VSKLYGKEHSFALLVTNEVGVRGNLRRLGCGNTLRDLESPTVPVYSVTRTPCGSKGDKSSDGISESWGGEVDAVDGAHAN